MDNNLKEVNVIPRVLPSLMKILAIHHGIFGKDSLVADCTGALIDKERGVIVTHAIIAQGNQWKIWLSTTNKAITIELDRRLIHWDANLAFLKIPDRYLPFIDSEYNEIILAEPSPAEEKRIESEFIEMRMVGFVLGNESEEKIFKPLQKKCDIARYRSRFGITMPMLKEETRLRYQARIADEDRAKLFRKYIDIYCHEDIVPGMSGFLLTTTDGAMLGILDRGLNRRALAIPSSEINAAFQKFFR